MPRCANNRGTIVSTNAVQGTHRQSQRRRDMVRKVFELKWAAAAGLAAVLLLAAVPDLARAAGPGGGGGKGGIQGGAQQAGNAVNQGIGQAVEGLAQGKNGLHGQALANYIHNVLGKGKGHKGGGANAAAGGAPSKGK